MLGSADWTRPVSRTPAVTGLQADTNGSLVLTPQGTPARERPRPGSLLSMSWVRKGRREEAKMY